MQIFDIFVLNIILIAFYGNIMDIYMNTYIKIYKDKCHTIENLKRTINLLY